MDDIERMALAFDKACRRAGVTYAFIVGMAVITWGQPRFTADLDTLVQIKATQDAVFAEALAAEGLRLDAREDPSHLSIFDKKSQFHLDVKLAITPEEIDQVENARSVILGGNTLRVASPEDTVAFKVAYGSPQDIQDARSILVRQQSRLNLDRLHRTARRLDVLDQVEGLRIEAQKGEA